MKYEWKLDGLIGMLLPPILRKKRMMAWLQALLLPVSNLHQQFMDWKEERDYEFQFRGQVISLEALLNDQYDYELRRIRINTIGQAFFLFKDGSKNEAMETLFFFKDIVKADTDLTEEQQAAKKKREDELQFFFLGAAKEILRYDFVIHVPQDILERTAETGNCVVKRLAKPKNKDLSNNTNDGNDQPRCFDEIQFRAMVDRYKLAGKHYYIQPIYPAT